MLREKNFTSNCFEKSVSKSKNGSVILFWPLPSPLECHVLFEELLTSDFLLQVIQQFWLVSWCVFFWRKFRRKVGTFWWRSTFHGKKKIKVSSFLKSEYLIQWFSTFLKWLQTFWEWKIGNTSRISKLLFCINKCKLHVPKLSFGIIWLHTNV